MLGVQSWIACTLLLAPICCLGLALPVFGVLHFTDDHVHSLHYHKIFGHTQQQTSLPLAQADQKRTICCPEGTSCFMRRIASKETYQPFIVCKYPFEGGQLLWLVLPRSVDCGAWVLVGPRLRGEETSDGLRVLGAYSS